MMRTLHILPRFFVFLAGITLAGCHNETTGKSGPIGEVAKNAAEAWPTRPFNVPPITREQLLSACARYVACDPTPADMVVTDVGFCTGQVEFSAERAIPISALMPGWERSEYFVDCVSNAVDCAAVNTCFHARPDKSIYCEEDGCRASKDYDVACNGDQATLKNGDETLQRDCASAFAQCDADSPTGCTDRQFTVCSDKDAPDRCEGNVRIGCDTHGQVNYRDCERLSGTCGQTADGNIGCVYDLQDPECTGDNFLFSYCDAGNIVACVTGHRTSVPAPELCMATAP